MKARKSLSARFTALCASTLMASACSTAPPPRPMPTISGALLATPARLPIVQRTEAGQMTGAQCHGSLLALYDVAGQIRATLIDLQGQLRLARGAD